MAHTRLQTEILRLKKEFRMPSDEKIYIKAKTREEVLSLISDLNEIEMFTNFDSWEKEDYEAVNRFINGNTDVLSYNLERLNLTYALGQKFDELVNAETLIASEFIDKKPRKKLML
jgi:hypothetical protein